MSQSVRQSVYACTLASVTSFRLVIRARLSLSPYARSFRLTNCRNYDMPHLLASLPVSKRTCSSKKLNRRFGRLFCDIQNVNTPPVRGTRCLGRFACVVASAATWRMPEQLLSYYLSQCSLISVIPIFWCCRLMLLLLLSSVS